MNKKKLSTRIFYCGMVNTNVYSKTINLNLFIGAAANKMLSVVSALRDADAKSYLLSIPSIGYQAHKNFYIKGFVLHENYTPQIFMPILANRYLRKLFALLPFAWFCLFKIKKVDKVIFYNYAFEYVLGLIILRLKGNIPFLDIEDAPYIDKLSIKAIIELFFFKFYFLFTCDRNLVVSRMLAIKLSLNNYCVVYGAIKSNVNLIDRFSEAKSNLYHKNSLLTIHYGGNLLVDTGVDLFCNAIQKLSDTLTGENNKVHFIVTGFGSDEKIRSLSNYCEGTNVKISFYPNVTQNEYLKLLKLCHAALALKMPQSQLAITTFPSKVVEITSNGLLLITTKASDVPLLFDKNSAILLSNSTPIVLANTITHLLSDMELVKQVAICGNLRATYLFESKKVGMQILDFLA